MKKRIIDWFIKWVLTFYLKFLEAGIDPENFDSRLSRKIDCTNYLIENDDGFQTKQEISEKI